MQIKYTCSFDSGIPSNPNRDFQWVKIKQSKLNLCKRMFQIMPQFFHHHQIDLAQRDGLKINFSQISPESLLLILIADYVENYTHPAQVPYWWNFFHFPVSHDKSVVFDLQLMSQMRWFHKLSSVILIILAHYWDYELNRRVCCAHHCISDDLNKSNEQMTHCFDFVRYTFLLIKLKIEQNFLHRHQRIWASFAVRNFYDQKNAQLVPPQPQNKHLHIVTDNAGNQCKNV